MAKKPTQKIVPTPIHAPGTDQLLEHVLVNHDNHAHHQARLAENKLLNDHNNAQHTHRLLEGNLEMHDRTQKAISDSGDKVVSAVKSMASSMAPKEIADQAMFCVKGVKGDPGKDSTVPGPKGEKGDSVKGDKGDPGVQGIPGKDSVVPGPRGERGEKGDRGERGNDGESIVGPMGPAGKDGVKITSQEIITKIQGKFSYNDLKDVPAVFKQPAMAGTGYLREISDVNTTGLQHGQVLIWNATTNKWEPGTPASSSPGAFPPLTQTQINALTPVNGQTAYNTTTDSPQIYIAGAWYNIQVA
jgi:hypothetical protein